MSDLDPLVAALIAEREKLGLSIRETARRAGVNPSNIHSWEMGIASPKLIGLRRWVGGLGLELLVESDVETHTEWRVTGGGMTVGYREREKVDEYLQQWDGTVECRTVHEGPWREAK